MTNNRVIIRNVSQMENNIHLAVHPFAFEYMIRCIEGKDKIDHDLWHERQISERDKRLAHRLFDEVPALSKLFFTNGSITLQHEGVLPDSEVVEIAALILWEHLEETVVLSSIMEGLPIGEPIFDLNPPTRKYPDCVDCGQHLDGKELMYCGRCNDRIVEEMSRGLDQ